MAEYEHRKPWELEPHYSNHVSAMTSEGLHEKSAIAAELAFRDQRIERLEKERDGLVKAIADAHRSVLRGDHGPRDNLSCMVDAIASGQVDRVDLEREIEGLEKERDDLREQFHSDGAIAQDLLQLHHDAVTERDGLRAALIECRVAINEACYRGRDRVRLLEADERASRVLDERKPENLEEQKQ